MPKFHEADYEGYSFFGYRLGRKLIVFDRAALRFKSVQGPVADLAMALLDEGPSHQGHVDSICAKLKGRWRKSTPGIAFGYEGAWAAV